MSIQKSNDNLPFQHWQEIEHFAKLVLYDKKTFSSQVLIQDLLFNQNLIWIKSEV